MESSNYGCIIFENEIKHDAAWACIAGEEPFYISSLNDLSTDVIWLTNISFEVMKESRLLGNTRYRHDQFLRIDVNKLIDFFGLHKDLKKQAWAFSQIFYNVCRLYYGLMPKDVELDHAALKNGVRKCAGEYDLSYTESMAKIIDSATVNSVNCERQIRREDSGGTIFFRCSPIEHMSFILSAPLPTGKWIKVDLPSCQDSSEHVLEWLSYQDSPMLISITIKKISDKIGSYINYGSGGKYNREWVTSPELAMLLPFSDIVVNQAYKSEYISSMKPLYDFVRSVPEVSDLSISFHLFLDNIWTGLSSNLKTSNQQKLEQKTKDQKKKKPKRAHNHAAPFLRAHDRFFCLQKVVKLASLGYDVAGYGGGLIRVDIPNISDQDIYNIGYNAGLIPPMCFLNESDLQHDAKHDNTPIGILQNLYALNMFEKLMYIDNQVVEGILKNY